MGFPPSLGDAISFVGGKIIGGGDRQFCTGVEVCVQNNLGETCESAQAIINNAPAELVNEAIVTFQAFATSEHNRKGDNSRKRGLPTKVRPENLAGVVMYLIGGENDCRIGSLERPWEQAWSAWKAKALATRGTTTQPRTTGGRDLGVGTGLGRVIEESIRQAQQGRQQIGGTIVSRTPAPLPGGTVAANQAAAPGLFGASIDPTTAILVAGGVGLLFFLRR